MARLEIEHRSFFPSEKATTDDEETWFEHDDHAIKIHDDDVDGGALSAAEIEHRSFFPSEKTTTDDEETWFEHDDHAIKIHLDDDDDADGGALSAAAWGDTPAFAAASSAS